MPIALRFLTFAKPALRLLLGIRFETGAPLHGQRVADAQQAMLVRELGKRLPPRVARDVLRDE
jgi:hypothetical protein